MTRDRAHVDPHQRRARAAVVVHRAGHPAGGARRVLGGHLAHRRASAAPDAAAHAGAAEVTRGAVRALDAGARAVAHEAQPAGVTRRLRRTGHADLHGAAAGVVAALHQAREAGVAREALGAITARAVRIDGAAGELHLGGDQRRRQRPVGRRVQVRAQLEVARQRQARHQRLLRPDVRPEVHAGGQRGGPQRGRRQADRRGRHEVRGAVSEAHLEVQRRALGHHGRVVEQTPVRHLGLPEGVRRAGAVVDPVVGAPGAHRGAHRGDPADGRPRGDRAHGAVRHLVVGRPHVALDADGGLGARGGVTRAAHLAVEHVDGVDGLVELHLEGQVRARVGGQPRVVPLDDVATVRRRAHEGHADAAAAGLDVIPEREDGVLDGRVGQRLAGPQHRRRGEAQHAVGADPHRGLRHAVVVERERQGVGDGAVVGVRQETDAPGLGAGVDPGQRRDRAVVGVARPRGAGPGDAASGARLAGLRRAEHRVRRAARAHPRGPRGDRVGPLVADHLVVTSREARPRTLAHRTDVPARPRERRAPLLAGGPHPVHAVALAQEADVLGAAVGVRGHVAGQRRGAGAAGAARPHVIGAAAVALVGDRAVVVVAVGPTGVAEAEAVAVVVDALRHHAFALTALEDHVRGAILGSIARRPAVHRGGCVKRDSYRGILVPHE